VKITTSLALVILSLRVEMTTPGMARKPTFAESITVDWNIVHVKLINLGCGATAYQENQFLPFFQ
jgi:hypothetical protein